MTKPNLVGVKIIEDVKHEQTHRVLLDHKALERAVADWVQDRLTITTSGAGVNVRVFFERETKGSPGYSVGTKAEVCITRDMRTQDAGAVA